ncbi:MAG: bifunctional DNA primase/polymerase, partial [Verrucomicrobiae bacterium]|nr:bifunctional DNA primase/polymerase [Verrucomicrobiae bacterium]
MSLLEASGFYVDGLGLAVMPLRSIHDAKAENPGKQPMLKDYRKLKPADCDGDFRSQYWSEGSNLNIGGVVQAPFVWLDFDDKKGGGAAARSWLHDHPEAAKFPRTGTKNGFHIPVIVRDLPAGLKKTSVELSADLVVEIIPPGHPVTLAPSLRLDGSPYEWEVTGRIAEMSWPDLCAILGYDPDKSNRGRKRGVVVPDHPFKGDLTTLDLVGVLRELDMLGRCLDEKEAKWEVLCPWNHEHSSACGAMDSSTVVFAPQGVEPSFKCLHAHCAERKLTDFLLKLEAMKPGIVDRYCKRIRYFDVDESLSAGGLPLIVHPGPGRLVSEVATEIGGVLKLREAWFRRNNQVVRLAETGNGNSARFMEVNPIMACAGIEEFICPVIRAKGCSDKSIRYEAKSFDRETMAKIVAAPQLVGELPDLSRIIASPLAIRGDEGELADLRRGYNPEHRLYLDWEHEGLPGMSVEDALSLIQEIHEEFGFEGEQDRIHAFARLLTPFVRPIIGWTARVPLFLYLANRPRAGKDYLAMIPLIVFDGVGCEDAPLEKNSEETRKRITAALISGRRFMHFANCQGHIDDAALIGAITARTWSARKLGGTSADDDLRMPNEMEFSLSANVGLTYREDIEPRTRQIRLAYFDEDPNQRSFRCPDLHGRV